MTRRTFYDDINFRAKQEFGKAKIDAAVKECLKEGPLWKEWEACWWKHANKILEELKEEGLTGTFDHLHRSLSSAPKAKEYLNVVVQAKL